MTTDYRYVYGTSNAGRGEGYQPNPNRFMTISDDVSLPDSDVDPFTGRLIKQEEASVRHQRYQTTASTLHAGEAHREEKEGLKNKQIKRSLAIKLFFALFVLLGIFTLMNRAELLDADEKRIRSVRGVQQTIEANQALQQEIDEAISEQNICSRALDLGMIRAGDAQTIPLIAVDAYPEQVPQMGYTAEVVVDGWEQVQPTQLPMTANLE